MQNCVSGYDYYWYRQNNSGGKFYGAHDIYIRELSPELSNEFAEQYTQIYFDGCEIGNDCECCGDRWYRANRSRTETPKIPHLKKQVELSYFNNDGYTSVYDAESKSFLHFDNKGNYNIGKVK